MTPEHVKSIRRLSRLTQAKLAETLGVSTGTVNGWETGRKEMSRQSAAQLELFESATMIIDWLSTSHEYGMLSPEVSGFVESALDNPLFSALKKSIGK